LLPSTFRKLLKRLSTTGSPSRDHDCGVSVPVASQTLVDHRHLDVVVEALPRLDEGAEDGPVDEGRS
jgi:hypothetical protein